MSQLIELMEKGFTPRNNGDGWHILRPWTQGRNVLEPIHEDAIQLASDVDLIEVLNGEFGKIAILKSEPTPETPSANLEDDIWNLLSSKGRLEALARSGLLDSPPEESFDRLTRLASSILKCPISLISIVSAERQYFKSFHGLQGEIADTRQTPLSDSICKHVAVSAEPFIVNDTLTHPFTQDIGLVKNANLRSYAGFPLWSLDKHALGAFCVIDTVPRNWTAEELTLLKEFADMAGVCVEAAEMRRHLLAEFFD